MMIPVQFNLKKVFQGQWAPVQPPMGQHLEIFTSKRLICQTNFRHPIGRIVLVGSGSAANDACIGSLCPDGKNSDRN
jgi:hypothetical protein